MPLKHRHAVRTWLAWRQEVGETSKGDAVAVQRETGRQGHGNLGRTGDNAVSSVAPEKSSGDFPFEMAV